MSPYLLQHNQAERGLVMSKVHSTESIEVWKDVIRYEGLYKVSNQGRVKSLTRKVRSNWKGNWRIQKGRFLSPNSVGEYGHLIVCLCHDGKVERCFIHHLVLEAFVGPCPPGMECRHFPDRNPANNKATNLQWSNHKDNIADQLIHGTRNRGERHGNAKLTKVKVTKAKELLKQGYPQKPIATILGISQTQVSRINTGDQWGWLQE